MKQKRQFYLLAILSVAFFAACSDDDDEKQKDKLPETARTFIESRLDGYSILNVEEVDDNGNESNEKYVVTLSNDIIVSFSSFGYWRRIESSSELPELLQQEISYDGAKKVKDKYPSKTINKMYFLPYFYKVVLNDDTSLILYNDSGTEIKVGVDKYGELGMNKKIYDFIVLYYARPGTPNRTYEFFQEEESDGSGFRLYVSDGQLAYFDKDGEWYYASGGSSRIYEKMYQSILPQELRDIIENEYKGTSASVHRIIYHQTYYRVLLRIGTASTAPFFILYDIASKSEVEPPTQAVLDFLNTYVGEPNKDMVLSSTINPDPKKIIYTFNGLIGTAKVMTMYMDIDGHVYGITLNGSEIPRKILDYLPVKVKEYVIKNKSSDEIIVSVANGINGEYSILFRKNGASSSVVLFDKDGNVLN